MPLSYEPIWAISTMKSTPAQAQAVHKFIRDHIEEDASLNKLSFQYGGSVNDKIQQGSRQTLMVH